MPVFLRILEGNDRDQIGIVVGVMPELLLQTKERRVLENTIGKMVDLYEDIENREKNPSSMSKDFNLNDRQTYADALLQCLRGVTGKDFNRPTLFRLWWNDRTEREQFLRQRIGP